MESKKKTSHNGEQQLIHQPPPFVMKSSRYSSCSEVGFTLKLYHITSTLIRVDRRSLIVCARSNAWQEAVIEITMD